MLTLLANGRVRLHELISGVESPIQGRRLASLTRTKKPEKYVCNPKLKEVVLAVCSGAVDEEWRPEGQNVNVFAFQNVGLIRIFWSYCILKSFDTINVANVDGCIGYERLPYICFQWKRQPLFIESHASVFRCSYYNGLFSQNAGEPTTNVCTFFVALELLAHVVIACFYPFRVLVRSVKSQDHASLFNFWKALFTLKSNSYLIFIHHFQSQKRDQMTISTPNRLLRPNREYNPVTISNNATLSHFNLLNLQPLNSSNRV